MDILKAIELVKGAIPAWNRLKEDGKRVDCFRQDLEEAFEKARAAGDWDTVEALIKVPVALFYKIPTGWSFDPFKGFRLLADDFARALGFERYKDRRNL